MMYVHRVAIDANRINVRREIPGMNRLEDYFRAGFVELVRTSTLLNVDLRGDERRAKAQHYPLIGSAGITYLTDGRVADATPGAVGRGTRVNVIHRIVLGSTSSTADHELRQMRDCLHIEQAWQNGVDYFVTNEEELHASESRLAAEGIALRICDADVCAAEIEAYFLAHYGTTDPAELEKRFAEAGPILLGSCSCTGLQLRDPGTGEELLGLFATSEGVTVRATIRGRAGNKLLTITPGQALKFEPTSGATVKMMAGERAPILLGEARCRNFVVSVHDDPIFSGWLLASGRLLIHEARFYSAAGELALRVERDSFEVDQRCVLEDR